MNAERPGRQPERTCLGCRSKGPKANLMRVVRRPDGVVLFDPSGRTPGRGAYLHPAAECIELAATSGVLGRALRAPLGPAEAASLMKELRELLGERA